jgi:hypothetical protein
MFMPKAQEIYRHFKGNLYQIIAVAEHSETGENLVVYQALYGENKVYARPLAMFTEKVDKEKYPDAGQEYRFELQEDVEPKSTKQPEEDCEEVNIDPMVLEFLDAQSYEERLNILAGLRHRITNEMLTTMAIVCDIELPEGDVEERYDALRTSLLTKDKYECSRMR